MYYEDLLVNLYKYLTGSDNYNSNIIRRHTKNLETLGEFSFLQETLNIYKSQYNFDICNLVGTSETWLLHLTRCVQIDRGFMLFVDRAHSYKVAIAQTLSESNEYGAHTFNPNILLVTDLSGRKELLLNELRVRLVKDVCSNLLRFTKLPNSEENVRTICFTSKSKSKQNSVLCGPVVNISGSKTTTTASEYYRKRTIDMRLMAQHKYGLRITSDSGWQEFFEKLGQAAVSIDLLQNKVGGPVKINLSDSSCSSSKGASFILYNCARLAQLFKEFDKRVSLGVYPKLSSLEEVNWDNLKEPEEWELLFLFVLQFPLVVKATIKDILVYKVNLHIICDFLSKMCATMSIYYRRVRILTEPREHLYDVLHARIYLLKAVEQVLHNGLKLLSIEPVKQM